VRTFVQKYSELVMGILSGFDRLVFRGILRQLAYTAGMNNFLYQRSILLKEFGTYVAQTTAQVKSASIAVAEKQDRPIIYLQSAVASKEEKAKEIMHKDGVKQGLICVFTAVEPCMAYDIFKNREKKKLELVKRQRKCLHIYQYWIDPVFGFMSARIQTWFPFTIQICINGREWLARQMDKAGVLYLRHDNCFTRINNLKKAQRLMDSQLKTDWAKLLDRVARRLNPAHNMIFVDSTIHYYWTTYQSEWATDIMFKNRASLDALFPSLVYHGMNTVHSPDVMRFLGHRLTASGNIHGRFEGEVVSDFKDRFEGVRIKHRIGGNSIKAYNKQGSVLRVETTINNPNQFKVYRTREGKENDQLNWLPMRKGIADLKRRAAVSQKANERYLETMAVVDIPEPMKQLVRGITQHTHLNGRRVRALNPWSSDDAQLLESVMSGEFSINGFRNRDLRPLLFESSSISKQQQRRNSAVVSRKLRMLRAHGLIQKVPRSHRYQLTKKGRHIISALIAARNANVDELSKLAA